MQLFLALTSLIAMTEISSTSALSQKLVNKAGRVENNDNNNATSYQWMNSYSVKFQGCHHIKQWNEAADDDEDVRIWLYPVSGWSLPKTDSRTAKVFVLHQCSVLVCYQYEWMILAQDRLTND
jgi:hypothetical protein